jgi:hypothetical protein
MAAEPLIATHDEPAARGRSNFIVRLNLAADGMPDHFEQMWTRTEDQQLHELCCIPFFPYGLSLGDVIALTDDQGSYRIEAKSGHRTLRIAVQDDVCLHEGHQELHERLVSTGARTEFRGHANGYCAVDIAGQSQADALIAYLAPLVKNGTLVWEWADPPVE